MYPFTLFKYSNINAKLKGMYAKKIKPKDLEELINQEDLKSAIFILKMKNPELNNLSDQANRIQIEAKLDEIIISDIIKIYRLLGRKDKIIFQQFIEKYKLKCIKSVFRRVFLNHDILYDNTENIREWTNSIFKDISESASISSKTTSSFKLSLIPSMNPMKYSTEVLYLAAKSATLPSTTSTLLFNISLYIEASACKYASQNFTSASWFS